MKPVRAMKIRIAIVSLFLSLNFVWAQAPASSGCTKNVSFAIAENGQPVPAIPKFVLKWLGGASRKQGFPGICFSQVPSNSATNYIVIVSTSASAFEGLKPSAHTYKNPNSGAPGSTSSTSYGGTWSYAYTGVNAPGTTDTLDLRRDDKPKAVDVRAFDQAGRTVSQGSLATISSRDKLLEKVLNDIEKDSPSEETRKALYSPLYYVNCDVEGQPVSPQLLAAADPPGKVLAASAKADPPAPTAAPAPPPPATFEIWSTPLGADVFLDGQFVGKTPYTAEVTPGEHTVNLRKKNFSIWERKVQALPGKRRVGGSLEQKVLVLQ
jgi:hypothetical protein